MNTFSNTKHPDYCPICLCRQAAYWGSARNIGDDKIQHGIRRCRNCGHLFVDGFSRPRDVGEAYSNQDRLFFPDTSFYGKRSKSPPTDGDIWLYDHLSKWNDKPGGLLDIGSGKPTFLRKLRNQGWDVSAVEVAKHANLLAEETGCKVYQAMFEDTEFPRRFDIIVALDVLEHSGAPIRFLEHVYTNLADGGIALFRFPNSASLRCWINGENWGMIRPLGHIQYFSPVSFNLACTRVGLQIDYWTSRDLSKYSGLRLRRLVPRPFGRLVAYALGRLTRGCRGVIDALGLGDQLLACVSRGSKDAFRGSKWTMCRRLTLWRPPRSVTM